VLEATAEGRGRLHLINVNSRASIIYSIDENNARSIGIVPPPEALVAPANVEGKKPVEKKKSEKKSPSED
jgi:hypothetical protein